MSTVETRLPRENLARAMPKGVEVREDPAGGRPTLFGHFARFGEWTEIESMFEGHFMEQIAEGAFTKTFAENRSNIKPTFQHGGDPSMGDQILGPITELREDKIGAYYEIPLYEGIPPLVMSGLRDGAYGASFRFRVTKDDVDETPPVSDRNPYALPERTIREVITLEFGPVSFPAYAGATAGVRSITDELMIERAVGTDPQRLAVILQHVLHPNEPALSTSAAETHSEPESRKPKVRFRTREAWLEWITQS